MSICWGKPRTSQDLPDCCEALSLGLWWHRQGWQRTPLLEHEDTFSTNWGTNKRYHCPSTNTNTINTHIRTQTQNEHMFRITILWYTIPLYDDHQWSSYMIITNGHQIWSSYMMVTHDDHVWGSYMTITHTWKNMYGSHTQRSYTIIIPDDHIRSSHMILHVWPSYMISYGHHIWWSDTVIIPDDHIWSSQMILIYSDHPWWSSIIIRYDYHIWLYDTGVRPQTVDF